MTTNSLIYAVAFVASLSMAGVASAQRSAFEGAYAGGQIGYSYINVEASTATASAHDNMDGFGGGGFVGFGGTNGQLYGAIEAELGYDGADWSAVSGGTTFEVETRLTYGVGFRVGGVIADKYLIYGRFGWVQTNAEASATGTGSGDKYFNGGRFGGGVEAMFAGNIGVRGEYTYTIYENIDVVPGLNVDPDQHLFRIGVAYYF